MRSDTPKSNHGAEVLRRSIAGRHAVMDVADIVGSSDDKENVHTLVESISRNPYGDLRLDPDDFWGIHDSLAEIRSLLDSEDE